MTEKESAKKYPKFVVVRVRGRTNVRHDMVQTLEFLNLRHQNHCVVIEATPTVVGMLRKINAYVTFGPIDDATLALLNEKRKLFNGKYYKLSPPRKGFGRKGIKHAFSKSGAIGSRREKINDLIQRMV